jgi:hypothetical protein
MHSFKSHYGTYSIELAFLPTTKDLDHPEKPEQQQISMFCATFHEHCRFVTFGLLKVVA